MKPTQCSQILGCPFSYSTSSPSLSSSFTGGLKIDSIIASRNRAVRNRAVRYVRSCSSSPSSLFPFCVCPFVDAVINFQFLITVDGAVHTSKSSSLINGIAVQVSRGDDNSHVSHQLAVDHPRNGDPSRSAFTQCGIFLPWMSERFTSTTVQLMTATTCAHAIRYGAALDSNRRHHEHTHTRSLSFPRSLSPYPLYPLSLGISVCREAVA